MAKTKTCFLVLLFATLFSFGQPQFTTYQQICQKTTDNSLCLQIIDSSTSPQLKKTPNGWLQILSDKCKSLSILTLTKIGDFLSHNQSPRLAKALIGCRTLYNVTIIPGLDNIQWFNLNKNNYPNYNRALGEIDKFGLASCIAEFNDPPAIPSPIDIFNVNVKRTLALTLQVLNLNQCNKIPACT